MIPTKDISNEDFHSIMIILPTRNLQGAVLATALEEIFTRITQDIFNATLSQLVMRQEEIHIIIAKPRCYQLLSRPGRYTKF